MSERLKVKSEEQWCCADFVGRDVLVAPPAVRPHRPQPRLIIRNHFVHPRGTVETVPYISPMSFRRTGRPRNPEASTQGLSRRTDGILRGFAPLNDSVRFERRGMRGESKLPPYETKAQLPQSASPPAPSRGSRDGDARNGTGAVPYMTRPPAAERRPINPRSTAVLHSSLFALHSPAGDRRPPLQKPNTLRINGASYSAPLRKLFVSLPYFVSSSRPPRYFRRASGMTTEPSLR